MVRAAAIGQVSRAWPAVDAREAPWIVQRTWAGRWPDRASHARRSYLVPDVNAWVMQPGGVMGFGARRVMGLGLLLMRILSGSQFTAV